MILKNDMDELDMVMKFKVDGFRLYHFCNFLQETIKCFGCGQEGHLVRSCPERTRESETESAPGAVGGSQDESDGEQTGAAAQESGADTQQDGECAATAAVLLSQPSQSSDEEEQEGMTFECFSLSLRERNAQVFRCQAQRDCCAGMESKHLSVCCKVSHKIQAVHINPLQPKPFPPAKQPPALPHP